MGVCILTTNRKQEIDPAFQSKLATLENIQLAATPNDIS